MTGKKWHSLSEIHSDELGRLHNKAYDFVTEMPTQESSKRLMRHQRNKAQGNQVEPNKSQAKILGEEFLKMNDGENFLLAYYGTRQNIIFQYR